MKPSIKNKWISVFIAGLFLLTSIMYFSMDDDLPFNSQIHAVTEQQALDISDERFAFADKVNHYYDLFKEKHGGEPSYVAGAFIDELTFTILVTDAIDEVQDDIYESIPPEMVTIEEAVYSKEELKNVEHHILQYLSENYGVMGVGIDEVNNQVLVEIKKELDSKLIYQVLMSDIERSLNGTFQTSIQRKMNAFSKPILNVQVEESETTPKTTVSAGFFLG